MLVLNDPPERIKSSNARAQAVKDKAESNAKLKVAVADIDRLEKTRKSLEVGTCKYCPPRHRHAFRALVISHVTNVRRSTMRFTW